MIGPTAEVIRAYYTRGQEQRRIGANDNDSGVMITQVTLYDENGPGVEFGSGGKLYITVEARARTCHDDMSVVIQIVDDNQYPIFETCTHHLSGRAITLDSGQTLKCTFEVELSLADGTFHVNAYLHRYVTNRCYDRWIAAATFFVASASEAHGVVRLWPRLADCHVEATCQAQTAGRLGMVRSQRAKSLPKD